jgi:hypothetical protein
MTEDKWKAQKEYYWKNKEKVNRQRVIYRAKNRDRIRANAREFYKRHKEELDRKAREYARTPKGKKYASVRNKKQREKKKRWMRDFKKDLKCARCGQSFSEHPNVLDFHHIDGETHNRYECPSQLFFRGSEGKFMKEIEKCEVVCANCHRIIHDTEVQNE